MARFNLGLVLAAALVAGLLPARGALAQRTSENVTTQASDAFGTRIGNERSGLYTDNSVRGFNPVTAGNVRLEGLYVDLAGPLTRRLLKSSSVRVGLAAQGYPFSSPSGIVDYTLRRTDGAPGLSMLVGAGDFGSRQLDLDASAPPMLGGRLNLDVGLTLRRDATRAGDRAHIRGAAIVPRLRLGPSLSAQAFWGRGGISDSLVDPILFPSSAGLPPRLKRRHYGETWARTSGHNELYGGLVDWQPAATTRVRALFARSEDYSSFDYADLFLDVTPTGAGRRVIIGVPPHSGASWSGEIRLAQTWDGAPFRHVLNLSLRGRRASREYGGTATLPLGSGLIGQTMPIERPRFDVRAQDVRKLKQVWLGGNYELVWRRVGEASLGIQWTRYEETLRAGLGAASRTKTNPVLLNGTAAIYLSRHAALYASYIRGLEESGVAPSNASNFSEILPAAKTRERDLGIRIDLRPNLKLVAGVFWLKRPYFSFDRSGAYVPAGEVINRGLELSLSGLVADGISLVVGGAYFDPEIHAEAAFRGVRRPVAIPRDLVGASVNYRPQDSDWSLDATINHTGRRYLTDSTHLTAPGYLTLDLGMRYYFHVAGTSAVARAVLYNATNKFAWTVYNSGGVEPVDPRRGVISLTLDW